MDFAQKPRGGRKDERTAGGKRGVDHWEAVHKQGPMCSTIQVPQREQYAQGALKRENTTWGRVVTLIYLDNGMFKTEHK